MFYATKTMEQWGPNLEYGEVSNNHLLINSRFLREFPMKLNDIFHTYETELFWLDGMIFVPLIWAKILHLSGIL